MIESPSVTIDYILIELFELPSAYVLFWPFLALRLSKDP